MKIIDYLSPQDIVPTLEADNLEDVLREFAQHLGSLKKVKDPEKLVEILLEREKLGSTGIGNGVAIPHGRLPGLDKILVAFGRSPSGIDFHAHDDQPVHLFFLLVAPEESAGAHLKALARISKILKSPDCRRALMESANGEKLFEVISQEDERH
ncbi:MAG: PTS sugar transporter subunit IIA [bacterium]|nr:MAG: PTS sugar transporter subunit IIA [bacterium]